MKTYLLTAIMISLSSLMGAVQIDNDPTFTKQDRALFRKLYSDENNISAKGPKINRRDFYGKTPLYSACEAGRAQVALFFLKELKADMDISAHNGFTPLQVASKNGHNQVVDLLTNWKKESLGTQPDSLSVSTKEPVRNSPNLVSDISSTLSMDDLLKANTPNK